MSAAESQNLAGVGVLQVEEVPAAGDDLDQPGQRGIHRSLPPAHVERGYGRLGLGIHLDQLGMGVDHALGDFHGVHLVLRKPALASGVE
ncbi:hypothetical protein D9M71_822500 [compost metagenome]